MPNPWVTTTLTTEPLTTCCYNYNISSLSANTSYEYRSYFIANGNPYYGDILVGTTLAVTKTIPTVTTGNAATPLTTSFSVLDNIETDNGGVSTIEYGILYSQGSAYGTDSTLILNGTCVSKDSTCGDVVIPNTYTNLATGLLVNKLTYYRAFAKNCVGVGYGTVCTQMTAPSPLNQVSICVYCNYPVNGTDMLANACACFDYSISRTTGNCFYPIIHWNMSKATALYNGCAYACIKCNNICILGWSLNGSNSFSNTGNFTLFCVDNNDCIELFVGVCSYGGSTIEKMTSCLCIESITNCSGNYNYTTPNCVMACTSYGAPI